MKRAAFTMIELVMVIVVLGILAIMALPRMERDIRTEAADNILSAIRFTQHMALMDNVERPGVDTWQRSFWRFGKSGCADNGIFYFIGSDKDRGGAIGEIEAAIDPANGNWMLGQKNQDCEGDLSGQTYASGRIASKNIFLTKLYGISEGRMTFSSSCNTANGGEADGSTGQIAFDYLGRPHSGITALAFPNYGTMLATDCNITLSFDDLNVNNVIITIEKETGRAFIAN